MIVLLGLEFDLFFKFVKDSSMEDSFIWKDFPYSNQESVCTLKTQSIPNPFIPYAVNKSICIFQCFSSFVFCVI